MMAAYRANLMESKNYWDQEAERFDDEPDHGLSDPLVLAAWKELVASWQPDPPAKILDIGCGTGSLSLVLAGMGHQVTGIDLSPKMIALATKKADEAGLAITFAVMDAAKPNFAGESFTGILCRHVLWMLPNLTEVLSCWARLLNPGGRLLLVEGFWGGGGLHQEEILTAVPDLLINMSVIDLSQNPALWGKQVQDERFAIQAERKRHSGEK